MMCREMLALINDLLVKEVDLSMLSIPFICVNNFHIVQISWSLKSWGYSF